jgi:hypothetical protein
MRTEDFIMRGLDEPSVRISIDGTSHFVHNMVPGWYRIDRIELNAGRINMVFMPNPDLPEVLGVEPCNVTISPNKALEIVVKVVDNSEDNTSATIKYAIINCKTAEDGHAYFHFDILEKDTPYHPKQTINMMASVELLLGKGYKLVRSCDDESARICAPILKHAS